MYLLTVTRRFCAAHHLRDYDGKCANLHGHNYRVEITVAGERLDETGMLIDFAVLKAVCDEVLDRFDHAYLNELPEFAERNVTAEHLAQTVYRQIAERLAAPGVDISEVRLYETEDSATIYRED